MLTIEVATRGEEKKKLIYPFTFTPLHFFFNNYFDSPTFSWSHVFFGFGHIEYNEGVLLFQM